MTRRDGNPLVMLVGMAIALLSASAGAWLGVRMVYRTAPGGGGEASKVSRPAEAAVSSADVGAVRFEDVAENAGLTDRHFNAADGRFRLVETMGSGLGLIDYDNDGWLDVYVLQGAPIPRDSNETGGPSAKMYRNQRDGTFVDVTSDVGGGFRGFGQGVAVGDYDGDGDEDLYVSGFGSAALYRNDDGRMVEVTKEAGLENDGWGSSCAFADLDGDGDLDLFVVHYLAGTVDRAGNPTVNCNAAPGKLGYCPPGAFAPEADRLYRNNGDWTFTDVSEESGIAKDAGNGLGLAISDWDEDGRLDVFVANDRTPNLLWRGLGEMRFEDVGLAWGLAYNESGLAMAGMGVASGDADGDGRSDLLVTNFYEEANTLYRAVGPGSFVVTTAASGLAMPSRGVLGFGAGFFDADLDGRQDLFVSNGHINDVRELGMPYEMPPQLFMNRGGGRFVDASKEAGAYFEGKWLGRGAAFGDLDNDGDTDIVVSHLGRGPALLNNEGPARGNWIRVVFDGKGAERLPVGAQIVAETKERRVVQHVVSGTSYLSSSDPRVLVGVGPAKVVDRLTIRWPNGATREWRDVAVGTTVIVEPPAQAGIAREG